MKILSILSLIGLLILTTGCVNTAKKTYPREIKETAESLDEEREIYKRDGKTYTIIDASESHTERGQASWYGHAFHGRRTASGERFNMHEMTAAHSSITLPAYMRVTNLDNGKSVIVRVNDRLPRHKTRIIDLSLAAAKEIDMYRAGIANVEIERVYLEEEK